MPASVAGNLLASRKVPCQRSAMKRWKRLTALAMTFGAAMAHGGDFIRVDEDERESRLQTVVASYQRGDVKVDLIGAVHIADEAYYRELNEMLKGYECVLFEMIGGERLGERAPVKEPAAGDAEASALTKAYEKAARFLSLTGQMDHIDYTARNFIHADLTAAEFQTKQAERKETLLRFMVKAALVEQDPKSQPNSFRLLKAFVARDPDLVKLEIVGSLGAGDDQVAMFTGETVIIDDRNQRCMEVLEREIADGKRKLGIFYGAAHFPDMEERLVERGFKATNTAWRTAWKIRKPE